MNKTSLITTLIFLVCLKSNAQENILIDFESPNSIVKIDTSIIGNIWQIGGATKQGFNSAYSGLNAIITDTLGFYPKNNRSEFSITIPSEYLDDAETQVSLWHKFDTELKKDSGYVEYSFDGGTNWVLLNDAVINDQSTINTQTTHWDSTKKHGWTGSFNFSGNSDGWVYSSYSWIWFIPVKIDKLDDQKEVFQKSVQDFPFADSIILRFSFVSSSNGNMKNGWIIDDIKVSEAGFSNFHTTRSNEEIRIYPNPTQESFKLILPSNTKIETYVLYNSKGKCVLQGNITDHIIDFNVLNYTKGVYILQLNSIDNYNYSKTIVIN